MILTQDTVFKVNGFKLRLSTRTSELESASHCANSDVDSGYGF